jgi:hypothetical protein
LRKNEEKLRENKNIKNLKKKPLREGRKKNSKKYRK